MTKIDIAIIGAGGFSAEVIEAATDSGQRVVAMYDDNPELYQCEVFGVICRGSIADYMANDPTQYFIAIGNNRKRQEIDLTLTLIGRQAVSIIHPSAVVSKTSSLGAGSYIGAHCFVGPRSKMGRQVIVNVNSSIGHDCVFEDLVQICPGCNVGGTSQLEQGVFLGSNVAIAPKVKIGSWSRVTAGSFVARSFEPRCLAVGVPAKVFPDADSV